MKIRDVAVLGVGVMLSLVGCRSGGDAAVGGAGSVVLGPSVVLPELEGGLLPDPDPLPAGRDLLDVSADGVFVRSVCEAEVIDTRVFRPQIAAPVVSNEDSRRVKVHLPEHTRPETAWDEPDAGLRGFALGGVGEEPVVDPASVSDFTAIDRTGWDPPDPDLAVGPDHVVVTVNQSVAFYSKTGGLQFQQVLGSQGSPGFFEPVGAGTFAFDPKCFYDHHAGRFVVLALEVYQGQGSAYVTIAVSDDSDPNGVWYKYRTDAVLDINGTPYWWDYPGLGYDADAYYVTSNLFPIGAGGFGGAGFRVFDKADMLDGSPVDMWTTRSGGGGSVQVAHHYGDHASAGGAAYFMQANGGGSVRVYAIMDPLSDPRLVDINVGVPFGNGPGFAPAMTNDDDGNGVLEGVVTTTGNRIMNVAWRDGKLYGAHAVRSFGDIVARWYEIDLNGWPYGSFPVLGQAGSVDSGTGAAAFYPVIASNERGDVALAFATSAADERVRFWVTARRVGDASGEMGEPVLVREGTALVPEIPETAEPAGYRWGDYYDATVDPDGETFWAIGQTYEAGIGWDTRVTRFSVPAVSTPCSAADLVAPFGTLDLADITAFTVGFTSRDAAADVAAPEGVWDLADITAFVGAFTAGCP